MPSPLCNIFFTGSTLGIRGQILSRLNFCLSESGTIEIVLKLSPNGVRNSQAYNAIRGHLITIPQNPGPLLDILPEDGIAGGASDGAKEDSTPCCSGLTSFHPDQYGQPGIYLSESSDDGWRRTSLRCK
jgi:hypothetical protein